MFSGGQNRSTENFYENFFDKYLKILYLKFIQSILDLLQAIKIIVKKTLSSWGGGVPYTLKT